MTSDQKAISPSCLAPSQTPYHRVVTAPSTGSKLVGPAEAFRVAAYVEAVTYLMLLVAVVIYRVLDGPDFIGLLGPIHGIAFLVYLFLVIRIREDQAWDLWRTLLIIIASALPLGGFWAARHLNENRRPA